MDELPEPVWSGTFRVFGVDLKCHILNDGQRIIEADSVMNFMEALQSGSDPGEMNAFARWQSGAETGEWILRG